tara:strand:+ start:575 stop:1090 length:516 start_codon:yes stop_codon:yes gene_type:complete
MKNERKPQNEDEKKDFEKVVKINRVNKVVKGGKRLAFRAFTICGDQNGSFGMGIGKSKEVPVSIKKAIEKSKKTYKKVNIFDETIPHEVHGRYGASRVIIRPARKGTGVIAGGAVRIILEAIGIKNVVAKSLGSRNPINVAKATENALLKCKELSIEEKHREVSISINNGK